MKKKIVIVVAEGQVQRVLSEEDVEVEILDFDEDYDDEERQDELATYLERCEKTMGDRL